MTKSIESRRVQEALQLQVTAVKTYATRLSIDNVDQLDSDLVELDQAVGELRGMLESVPHRHGSRAAEGAPAASPATTRPERVAKGSETADGTQRLNE